MKKIFGIFAVLFFISLHSMENDEVSDENLTQSEEENFQEDEAENSSEEGGEDEEDSDDGEENARFYRMTYLLN